MAKNYSSVRRMWQYFKPMRVQLFGSILLGSITLISSIALMANSGWLISRAALMPPVLTLSIAVLGVRTFALSRGVARYAERLLSHNATFTSLTGIHRVIFDRLEHLAPAGLPAFRRGDLLARLVADVDTVQDLPLRVVLPISAGVIAASFATGLAAWILPAAGLILFLTLLFAATVIPAIATWSSGKTEQATAGVRGEYLDELIEFYSGNADIISLGQHDQALNRLTNLDDELTKSAKSQANTFGLASGLLLLAQGTAILASTWVAITAYEAGKLDGVMLAVLAMIPMAAFESVSNFPAAAMALARVKGSSIRIVEILDRTAPVIEPEKTVELASSDIQLTSVASSWPNTDRAAIKDISFEVPSGTSIGLSGLSGSGKSTIIALLLKFLVPTNGKYTLGNQDSISLTGSQIREKLILNSPEQHIFATTIAENLRIASHNPETLTTEQMWQALEKVQLADWVRNQPKQLETLIGERGSTMSGGQRQRLTLARLFIAKPEVWVLDEPTEHLDSALADQLIEAIKQESKDYSLIVASHRQKDLAALDQVYHVKTNS